MTELIKPLDDYFYLKQLQTEKISSEDEIYVIKLDTFLSKENFMVFSKFLKTIGGSYSRKHRGITFSKEPSEEILQDIESRLKKFKDSQKKYSIAKSQEYKKLYEDFMEKKSLKEIIGIIGNIKVSHVYSFSNFVFAEIQAKMRNMEHYQGILNSFRNWKKLGYSVLGKEKALEIRVPAPKRINVKNEDTQEEEIKTKMFFKMGKTFDISQTTAWEDYKLKLKKMDEKLYSNFEIDYEIVKVFVISHFPLLNIKEDFKPDEYFLNKDAPRGTFQKGNKTIILYEKKSYSLFHELGHFLSDELNLTCQGKLAYAKNEVIAELFSYLFTKMFDESAPYNFSYSNIWSNEIKEGFEIKEFSSIFNKISLHVKNLFQE